MAEVLVLAEHTADGEVKKVTLELLAAARSLGSPSVVWTGPGAEAAQPRLAEYGAEKVYAADSSDFGDYVVAPTAELLASLVASASPAAVLIAGTTEGKEIAGRLAVKTGSGVLTDVTDITAGPAGPVAAHANFGGAITVHATVTAGTSFTDSGLTGSSSYNYQVSAYDKATPPNVSALSSVYVASTAPDTQAPTVTFSSPTQGNASTTNITITGQATDAISGVASLTASVDGGPATAVTARPAVTTISWRRRSDSFMIVWSRSVSMCAAVPSWRPRATIDSLRVEVA